jgi:hypothetical protein
MTIYCDESGYTGADLLEKNQPHFVFSGVQLSDKDVSNIDYLIRSKYPVQGEIKGRNIIQNRKGQNAVLELFNEYADKAKIVYHDKKYALAAKIFEYAIEPNLISNSLAYKTGFHKYIATGLYIYFMVSEEDAENIFSTFLKALRGDKSVSIFDINHTKQNYLVWWLFEIVKHDPSVFYNEISGKISPWILELTSTSLLGILSDYGRNGKELTVICDNSNLYKNNHTIDTINHIGKNGKRIPFLGEPIGYKLKENIKTVNSKNSVGLQIADIFATSVSYSLKNNQTAFSKEILKIVHEKCLCNPTYCIMPDYITEVEEEKVTFFHKFMELIWKEQREKKA